MGTRQHRDRLRKKRRQKKRTEREFVKKLFNTYKADFANDIVAMDFETLERRTIVRMMEDLLEREAAVQGELDFEPKLRSIDINSIIEKFKNKVPTQQAFQVVVHPDMAKVYSEGFNAYLKNDPVVKEAQAKDGSGSGEGTGNKVEYTWEWLLP